MTVGDYAVIYALEGRRRRTIVRKSMMMMKTRRVSDGAGT